MKKYLPISLIALGLNSQAYACESENDNDNSFPTATRSLQSCEKTSEREPYDPSYVTDTEYKNEVCATISLTYKVLRFFGVV